MTHIAAARIRALLAALAVLGVTIAAALALGRLDRARVTESAQAEAQSAGLRAFELLGIRPAAGRFLLARVTDQRLPRLVVEVSRSDATSPTHAHGCGNGGRRLDRVSTNGGQMSSFLCGRHCRHEARWRVVQVRAAIVALAVDRADLADAEWIG